MTDKSSYTRPQGQKRWRVKPNNNKSFQVYVACLASYNAGKLFGKWIDITDAESVDEVHEEISEMLSQSPQPGAEEWRIDDTEYLPGGLGLEGMVSFALAVADHGQQNREALAMLLDCGAAIEDLSAEFSARYKGSWEDGVDFAEDHAEQHGLIREKANELERHIDWKSYARELLSDGFWGCRGASGKFHVFASS